MTLLALLFGSDSNPVGSLWTLWRYSKQPLTAPWDALGALLSPVSYPQSSVAPSASCSGALDLHFGILFGSVWRPLGEHLVVYLPQMGRFQGRRLLTFPKQQLPESTLPLFMVRPFTLQVARVHLVCIRVGQARHTAVHCCEEESRSRRRRGPKILVYIYIYI